jgi:hypothetical protein
VTEIPFLADLGDAFEVAIAARARQESLRRRRRRPRRMAAVAAATAAVALLVASPAIGLRGHIVRLFSDAPRAPERVVKSLTELEAGMPNDPQGSSPGLDAREVLDEPVGSDQRAVVWLALRTGGGFCSLLELQTLDGTSRGGGAECIPLMQQRLSVETSLRGGASSSGEILSGPVLIDGWVSLTKADSVEVQFEGGGAVTLPFVWVADPVNAGFFVFGVPQAHWQAGRLPTEIVVRDAAGKDIAHEPVTGIDLRASFDSSTNDR